MAISREQAVLELVLEVADTLKSFHEVERQYEQTIQSLRTATDKADIDRLSRDAKEARDSMERLSRQGQAQLKKLADSGQLASNEYKELRVNVDRLENAIEEADRELRQFNREGGKVDRVTKGVHGLRAAWAAVGTVVASIGIARVLRTILEATQKQEAAQAQITAAIKSTGGAAGVTAEEMYDMARGLQAVTTFGDETILGMQSLLLTFTSLRKKELPEITERVLDLATALAAGGEGGQVDLRSAAVQLGKALQDPIRGITALRRSGIDFTEAQQDQIKVLVESNRLYDAQRLILDALAIQVGGRARAAANTLTGALQQAKNVAGDFAEEVGSQGLSRELQVLSRLFVESAKDGSSFGRSIGQVITLVVSLGGRMLILFDQARGAIATSQAVTLGALQLLFNGASKIFDAIERLAVGVVKRIASLIPDVDLPGQLDNVLREFVSRLASNLEAGTETARQKREEIQRELELLIESLAEVGGERFEAARQLAADLERIRSEIEAAGEAGSKVLRPGLEDGAEGAETLTEKLGATADEAARAKGEIEGLAAAAERVPVTRFRADLEVDEGSAVEELAAVQARLEELRSGLFIDPEEEQALLARESELLFQVAAAQKAWQEVQEDSNRTQGEAVEIGQKFLDQMRLTGRLTGEVTDGLGLSADEMERVNQRIREAGEGLGEAFDNVDDATRVTLPELDQSLLDAARDSGELEAGLQAMSERLLATAGAAEQQGAALETAGEQGADAQRAVAEETEEASKSLESQVEVLKAIREQQEWLGTEGVTLLRAYASEWDRVIEKTSTALDLCRDYEACLGE